MARRNNQTNALIRWAVIAGDLLLLNGLIFLFRWLHPDLMTWQVSRMETLWVVCNLAMIVAQWKFGTIIHRRLASAGDILRRVFELVIMQTMTAYLVMKAVDINQAVGWLLLNIGVILIILLIIKRFVERSIIKRFRQMGMNTRTVTFVGNDPELDSLYKKLIHNPTLGYKFTGYYADVKKEKGEYSKHLGTIQDMMTSLMSDETLELGDEVYVCLPRRESQKLKDLSDYCDSHVVRFYYVPPSVERLGMRLKRELFDDMEVFTTHEIPLENPVNKSIKRIFDIVVAIIALVCCLPLLPVVAICILIQSPGPLFFRQERTGANGRDFVCYKFRSMHVNKDADTVQATKNDPRKFPFGDWMRKYNIDELPQFWNVLIGNMSVVGPRPHMLFHTETYRQQINKYMVRHFVKPGITGWAQVTGFRGETKELWEMEERIRRDIWYIEHWSIWLDLRIIWLTVKGLFIHDEKAY